MINSPELSIGGTPTLLADPNRSPVEGTKALASRDAAFEAIEMLSAIMANGHACQNWLSTETPNLNRARLSINRMLRDADGLTLLISRIRSSLIR